jgi:hypothetical protein
MPGPNGRLIEDISAIRIALERFAAEQTDAAVRFLACLEYRLASAAERYRRSRVSQQARCQRGSSGCSRA